MLKDKGLSSSKRESKKGRQASIQDLDQHQETSRSTCGKLNVLLGKLLDPEPFHVGPTGQGKQAACSTRNISQ